MKAFETINGLTVFVWEHGSVSAYIREEGGCLTIETGQGELWMAPPKDCDTMMVLVGAKADIEAWHRANREFYHSPIQLTAELAERRSP